MAGSVSFQPADGHGPVYPPGAIQTTAQDLNDSSSCVMSHKKAPLSSTSDQLSVQSERDVVQQIAPSQALPQLQICTSFVAGNESMVSSGEPGILIHHSQSLESLHLRLSDPQTPDTGCSSKVVFAPHESASISPQLVYMGDITPLPSPVGSLSSWMLYRVDSQSLSRASSSASRPSSAWSLRASEPNQMLGNMRPSSRGKQYILSDTLNEKRIEAPRGTCDDTFLSRARNRSLSEYTSDTKNTFVDTGPVIVVGLDSLGDACPLSAISPESTRLHREQYLAIHRGISSSLARQPSPPSSGESDSDSSHGSVIEYSKDSSTEVYSAQSVQTQRLRKYVKIRELGQGAFSQVNLAACIETKAATDVGSISSSSTATNALQRLVAVKIVEHGPAGGADEERLEVSLKREVEILKSISYPSLVQLKAFGNDSGRALLVFDYCPGGDLFEVTSSMRRPMCVNLIRRIFAELVAAVRYLHERFIVHRDIKLENVLVNIPAASIAEIMDWCTYGQAVVTLSDFGLSRRIPQPPESPLLHTRCGSEDYAAPEILMGQPYDGRSSDAWALGVLLYAMMENRLPFDALPGTRGDPRKLRARTAHRIARCEWSWYRYADANGEWDSEKGAWMEGARDCVESLLKRNSKRKNLDDIAASPWVRDAIDVPGGLRRVDGEAS